MKQAEKREQAVRFQNAKFENLQKENAELKEAPNRLTISGLTEQDIQTAIEACKVAAQEHNMIAQNKAHLLQPGERVAHLSKASKFNELAIKFQNI